MSKPLYIEPSRFFVQPGERDTPSGYDFTIDVPLPPAQAIRLYCRMCTGDDSEASDEDGEGDSMSAD